MISVWRLIGIGVVCLQFVFTARCSAGELTVADAKEQLLNEYADGINVWRDTFHSYMTLHVEQLQSACDLDESQLHKLQIAAKGASERFVEHWIELIARRAVKSEEEDAELEAITESLDVDAIEEFRILLGVYPVVRAINRDRIWTRTIETCLNKQQHSILMRTWQEREKGYVQNMVRWVLQAIDREFLLSKEQKKKLLPLVTKSLTNKYGPTAGHVYGTAFLFAWVYSIPQKTVKPILNKSQLKLWAQRAELFEDVGEEFTEGSGLMVWYDLLQEASDLVAGKS